MLDLWELLLIGATLLALLAWTITWILDWGPARWPWRMSDELRGWCWLAWGAFPIVLAASFGIGAVFKLYLFGK